jgi:hypothetical protein
MIAFGLLQHDDPVSLHHDEQLVAGLHSQGFPGFTRNHSLVLG